MQLLVLAAAIINAQRPVAPGNKYWDDVVALPVVENGVLVDTRQTTISSKTVTLGTGRFGGQCMVVAETQMYTYGNYPFNLVGDFTIEGHAYFTGNGDNDYLFDSGGNDLVLKLVGNQWKVAYGGSATPLIDTAVTPAKNTWYHFAVVRQGALMKLYIDGVSVGQAVFTTPLVQAAFTWGNYTGGGPYSHIGRLDCCRISCIARYTGNFTPLMEPWPVGGPEAGFDPFWGQTILLTKDGVVDSTGKGTVVASGANATISTVQKRFGANSMKVVSNAFFRIDDTDNRFDFDTTDFTVEGWIYPAASLGGEVHLFGRSGASASGGYRVVLSNMRPRVYFSNAANSWTASAPITGSEVPVNRWTHIAMTRTGTVLRLFVNGKLLLVQAFAGTMNASTLPFTIGAASNSVEGFNGYIDSVRVTRACRYVESFTPKLLNDVASRGDAGGESLAGYDTWYPNTQLLVPFDGSIAPRRPTFTVTNPSASFTFDNTRKLFEKPTMSWVTGNFALLTYNYAVALIPSAEFTVESWVNSDYNGAADFSIASQWGATGCWGLTLRQGVVRFYYTSALYIQSLSNIAQGDWKHIAVSRRNGVITLYVNGVAEATVNYAGTFTLTNGMQVGKMGAAFPTTGYRVNMADLRITNGVSRYNTNFATPSKPHLVSGLAA